MDVDRIEAEEIAELLGIPVTAIPEDHDSLTTGMWATFLDGIPMPENIEERWECLGEAIVGAGPFGAL